MATEQKPAANAAAKAKEASPTKLVIGKVRFSYVHVWQPTAMEGQSEKKYSVSIIIPKSDTALIEKINKAVQAAVEQGKTGKFGGKLPPKLKLPLRDGDLERPGDEAYANSYFVSASSKQPPGIVDADRQEIIKESDFYSGCYGRASVNFYPFNSNGSKGVACGLNNLQKLEDGEALGGRGSAEEDFADDDDLVS